MLRLMDTISLFHWDGRHFDTQPLYTNYIGRDICDDEVTSRLTEAFNPYIQLLYGVHRTENLRDCFGLASENKVMNHRLVELLVTAIAMINGKHKVLPFFYSARETLYDSAGTFIPSVASLMAGDEYERFVSLVAEYASRKCTIRVDEVMNSFRCAMQSYVSNRRRRIKELPRLLPPFVRIHINRIRYRDGGRSAIGLSDKSPLNRVETLVRAYNCGG